MLTARLGALLLLAVLVANAQQISVPRSGKSPAPRLPAIDFDACGSPNPSIYSGEPLPFKLQADDRLYSSWQDSRALVRSLKRGTQVTRIGAVNITQEPDRGVITGEVDQSLGPLAQGDEVLGYGLHSDGLISFWGKGIWFTEYYENIAFKGACGFADKTACRVNIIKHGVQEWWIQLKTSDGVTGWILGLKQSGDKVAYGPNAGYACRD
ncbi:MAG: hypothetical protein JST79_18190 [Acidobacteria bacterium]|nr:hypothetical protein [Acidobacteriota bacterium]